MIYVISDLHGYPHERFLQLLEEASFGNKDFLYILGDVVDCSGDGGVATLDWLMYQTNVQLLLANAFAFDEMNEESVGAYTEEKIDMLMRYRLDGGEVTLKALAQQPKDTQQDILDYLRDCPVYETVSAGGRDFILVHAGLGEFDPKKHIEKYAEEDLMWNWPEITDVYYKKVTTVFGHRPTFTFGDEYADKIVKTDTWIDIDMGTGSGHEPVLLRLDDIKEFR